ncbi:hypothetical protein CH380_17735 [Leptospira adleri]|uniref:Uncharacterized protein n=1 Tax=Leptospira adleri TaxID=2023186 RepID=A0A2M9YK38_9LEPT|nr:hypothetical protein CH380_17735 [Leptospira adleri]PJZ61629.1 hypothetical protein CH376_12115 [Leptospira adleri]
MIHLFFEKAPTREPLKVRTSKKRFQTFLIGMVTVFRPRKRIVKDPWENETLHRIYKHIFYRELSGIFSHSF